MVGARSGGQSGRLDPGSMGEERNIFQSRCVILLNVEVPLLRETCAWLTLMASYGEQAVLMLQGKAPAAGRYAAKTSHVDMGRTAWALSDDRLMLPASLHACKLLELLRCKVLGRNLPKPACSDWLARIMDCFYMPCLLSRHHDSW
ncbi:unnamed protein product [Caretta caretta]